MSTLKPTRKVSRRHELREDTVVTLYARAIDIYENQRNLVYGAIGGIVLIALVIVGLAWNSSVRNEAALSEMAFAVDRYEDGAYRAALDGDITFTGLIDIAEEYGGTPSGNLATFYAADALYRVGDHDRALEYFRKYDKSADYLGASALAGEAAILEMRGEHETAGDLYLRAARMFESSISTPNYLMDAGRAFTAAGETDQAARAYQEIKSDWPESTAAQNIDFYLAAVAAGN
ncbi:MAG: tetratricopeptide repeat protein [Rhodothermales bacterium]